MPLLLIFCENTNEPRCEKTSFRGFRPGLTQTGLCSHRRRLEVLNFRFRKKRDCTSYVAKTKALISFAVTAKLICVFVFAYAKSRFSHDESQIICIVFRLRVTKIKLNLKANREEFKCCKSCQSRDALIVANRANHFKGKYLLSKKSVWPGV